MGVVMTHFALFEDRRRDRRRVIVAPPPASANPFFLFARLQPTPAALRRRADAREAEANARRDSATLPPPDRRLPHATKPAGTIIIDTPNTYLYLVLGNGRAIRYGIGVGREGFTWSGDAAHHRKAEWPDWTSAGGDDRAPALPAALHGRRPGQPARRARHVSRQHRSIASTAPTRPTTIGQRVSSGCIRLTNEDVTDLYSRVNVGTTRRGAAA